MKTFATAPRDEPVELRPCAQCSSSTFLPLWQLDGFSFVRCAACGLVQQNPQPVREAVLARYDESYRDYETSRQFEYAALERLALSDLGFEAVEGRLREAARAKGRAPRILDIGCATGALLDTFQRDGWSCLGVETCLPAVVYGRKTFGLDISAGTLEEAGFEAGSFELVHASHLIEHLNDPAEFLGEVMRLVSPGGYIIITTPNIDGFQARVLGASWRSAIYDHLYLFSRRGLGILLTSKGAEILKVATWGGWAAGLRPRFIKKPLDFLAKRFGVGDVMAFLCRREGR